MSITADPDMDLGITSLFDVKGKVVVVTGGATGIGSAFAAAYVQNGAKVYIASRNEQQLKETSEALTKRGPGSCHYFVADIGSKAGCETLAGKIKERESRIHILVNNAGLPSMDVYNQTPEENWDHNCNLSMKAVYYLTSALTDLLSKDANAFRHGSVINISSNFASTTTPFNPKFGSEIGFWRYSSAKAGMNHLNTLLATTLAPKHITVNSISPGVFASNMTAGVISALGEDVMSSWNPMGRIGSPKDIAGIALFLASPAGSYVTGANIVLDGGEVNSRVSSPEQFQ